MTTIRHEETGNKFVAVHKEAARLKKEEAKRFEKTLIFRMERDQKRKERLRKK